MPIIKFFKWLICGLEIHHWTKWSDPHDVETPYGRLYQNLYIERECRFCKCREKQVI